MLKTPSGLAGRDLPYIANILINSQIHVGNLKDPAEKDMLHLEDLLISSQIHAQNLTQVRQKRICYTYVCAEDMKIVRLLASSSVVLGLEQRVDSGERRVESGA